MQGKMAIIGDGDSILAFKSVGIEAFSVVNHEEAEKLIKTLAKDYKIIFITERLAKESDETIKKYAETPYPIILPVPDKKGSDGYGMENLKRAMDKALGVDILFNGKD